MHTRRIVVAVVAVCSLLLPLWDVAAEEVRRPTRLAEVQVSAGRVDWQPAGDRERFILTVAGPGGLYIQREFGAGEAPFLTAGTLPDGVYAYELRTGEREPQSGHLWVKSGSFVDNVPELLRPAPKPPLKKATANATVIADDLVVQGQACIGASCGAGDAAGPALKVKESGNYRILFDGLNCCLPSERRWALQANGNDAFGLHGDFMIEDVTGGTTPIRIGAGAPTNALTVLFNGNIGLGTLTPAVRHDVKASAAGLSTQRLQNSSATGYSGTEYLDNAGNVDLFFGVDNAASTTRLNSINNNPIVFFTNSAERMRITTTLINVPTGEVRIPGGTASTNGWPTHFNWPADGRNYIRGTTLIADDGGSVGIGTQAPSSKLHVNGGDIRVSGGSFIDDGTALNVPDYVFEPGYRLMPLNELREFVEREKHLPNVPSAADVKKDGLNLSQVQMRLLEKLEELTLYTLKQDEELKALRARLEELEKVN